MNLKASHPLIWTLLLGLGGTAMAAPPGGVEIPITADKPYVHVLHEGRSVRVSRSQDPGYVLTGYWAETARPCPPFCLQPMHSVPGVETIGEVEVIDFMEGPLRSGQGLLIDARTPEWFEKGTIPGSINVPFTAFDGPPDDPGIGRVLRRLGARSVSNDPTGWWDRLLTVWGLHEPAPRTAYWDFSDARTLVIWCNGPSCGQSPLAIRRLIALGYPAERLKYFRGGMQTWQLWGLTTVRPSEPARLASGPADLGAGGAR